MVQDAIDCLRDDSKISYTSKVMYNSIHDSSIEHNDKEIYTEGDEIPG